MHRRIIQPFPGLPRRGQVLTGGAQILPVFYPRMPKWGGSVFEYLASGGGIELTTYAGTIRNGTDLVIPEIVGKKNLDFWFWNSVGPRAAMYTHVQYFAGDDERELVRWFHLYGGGSYGFQWAKRGELKEDEPGLFDAGPLLVYSNSDVQLRWIFEPETGTFTARWYDVGDKAWGEPNNILKANAETFMVVGA